MAVIRKRGNSWQVQVRRNGFAPQSATFQSKATAQIWARRVEAELDRGCGQFPRQQTLKPRLAELLERYALEVATLKRGWKQEMVRIAAFRRHPIAEVEANRVTSTMIAAYRDERLKEVSTSTVRRDLALLSHVFEVGITEWGVVTVNPVKMVRFPSPSQPRQRRLMAEELEAFWSAAHASRTRWWRPFLVFALETGLRRGELLKLRWSDLDIPNAIAFIRETKNGHPRTIPLSPMAIAAIDDLDRSEDRIFPVSEGAVRQAWERHCQRAGLANLRLHDLRHEAISRFFEVGLSLPEVALISGHRDPRMLFRYTHMQATNVAKKLAAVGIPSESVALVGGPAIIKAQS